MEEESNEEEQIGERVLGTIAFDTGMNLSPETSEKRIDSLTLKMPF